MLAATLLVSSTSVLAAPRSIYIAGNLDSHGYMVWDAPLMSNAATFEDNKLVETADGSNVYTGTFELSDKSPFRFYTELYDDTADGSNSSMSWVSNVIAPSLDTDPALGNGEQGSAYVIERGNTSVFDGTGLYSPLTPYTPSGWWLPADRQGTYKMLLDLNDLKNVKVTLIPVNKYYVVRAGQPTPSLASISDYAPVGNPDFVSS